MVSIHKVPVFGKNGIKPAIANDEVETHELEPRIGVGQYPSHPFTDIDVFSGEGLHVVQSQLITMVGSYLPALTMRSAFIVLDNAEAFGACYDGALQHIRFLSSIVQ